MCCNGAMSPLNPVRVTANKLLDIKPGAALGHPAFDLSGVVDDQSQRFSFAADNRYLEANIVNAERDHRQNSGLRLHQGIR
jgi:hypothetical protein